jgi:hypothetical protein
MCAATDEGEEMSRTGKEPRETAEARFERIQKIATAESAAELTAVRGKTARLKALRMEKEAAEREAATPTTGRSGKRSRGKSSLREPA